MSTIAASRRRFTLPSWSGVLLLLILLIVLLGIFEPVFLSVDNMTNIIRSAAIPVVLGIGMTFAMLSVNNLEGFAFGVLTLPAMIMYFVFTLGGFLSEQASVDVAAAPDEEEDLPDDAWTGRWA